MADPEDSLWQEGSAPEGRPRRPPPTIDVKAVEVSPAGPGTTASAPGVDADANTMPPRRNRASSLSRTIAIAGSVGLIAAVVAGAFWLYLTPSGVDQGQRDGVVQEASKPDNVAPVQGSPDGTLTHQVAVLDATLARYADRIAALEREVRDSAAAAKAARERADAAVNLLDELKKAGAEQNSLQRRQQSVVGGLADRLKSLEEREAENRQKREESDRTATAAAAAAPDKAVRSAVVATALRRAVERDRKSVV